MDNDKNNKQVARHISKSKSFAGFSTDLVSKRSKFKPLKKSVKRCSSQLVNVVSSGSGKVIRIMKQSVTEINLPNKSESDINSTLSESDNSMLSVSADCDSELESSRSCRRIVQWVRAILIVLCAVIIYDIFSSNNCNAEVDIETVKNNLSTNLYGQDLAINDIVSVYESFTSKHPDIKNLVFVGGLGVGKSFTIQLLSEIFPWSSNIQQISVTDIKRGEYPTFNSLSHCGYNLIILDDLLPSDLSYALDLANLIKSIALEKKVKVMSIFSFSVQIMGTSVKPDVITNIQNGWLIAGLPVKVVEFLPLKRNHLKLCILRELEKEGIENSSSIIEEVTDDILSEYLADGCKRISTKVYFLIKEKFNLLSR